MEDLVKFEVSLPSPELPFGEVDLLKSLVTAFEEQKLAVEATWVGLCQDSLGLAHDFEALDATVCVEEKRSLPSEIDHDLVTRDKVHAMLSNRSFLPNQVNVSKVNKRL